MAMTVTSGMIKKSGTGVFIPGGARPAAPGGSPPHSASKAPHSTATSCSSVFAAGASPQAPASPNADQLASAAAWGRAAPRRAASARHHQAAGFGSSADWAVPLVGAMPAPGSSPGSDAAPIVKFVSLAGQRCGAPAERFARPNPRARGPAPRRASDTQMMDAGGCGAPNNSAATAATAAAAAVAAVDAAGQALAAAQAAAAAAAGPAAPGDALALQLALLQIQQQQLQLQQLQQQQGLQQLQQDALLQQMLAGGPPGLDAPPLASADSRWSDTSLFLTCDGLPLATAADFAPAHSNPANSAPLGAFGGESMFYSGLLTPVAVPRGRGPAGGFASGPVSPEQVLSAPLPLVGSFPPRTYEEHAGLGAFSLRPSYGNCW
jgi:hypothetical protein